MREIYGDPMNNPFAAATSTLIDRIAALTEKAAYETARERQALLDEAEALRVGWRVLEAAGDFTADDKERLEKALDQIPFYVPLAGYKCPGQVLRDKFKALLSAIPDKEMP
jgi:hypothetical protein